MSKMKACRDCRYVDVQKHNITPRCRHPQSVKEVPDYFEGRVQTIALSVDHVRTIGDCGPDAKLFEARGEG